MIYEDTTFDTILRDYRRLRMELRFSLASDIWRMQALKQRLVPRVTLEMEYNKSWKDIYEPGPVRDLDGHPIGYIANNREEFTYKDRPIKRLRIRLSEKRYYGKYYKVHAKELDFDDYIPLIVEGPSSGFWRNQSTLVYPELIQAAMRSWRAHKIAIVETYKTYLELPRHIQAIRQGLIQMKVAREERNAMSPTLNALHQRHRQELESLGRDKAKEYAPLIDLNFVNVAKTFAPSDPALISEEFMTMEAKLSKSGKEKELRTCEREDIEGANNELDEMEEINDDTDEMGDAAEEEVPII